MVLAHTGILLVMETTDEQPLRCDWVEFQASACQPLSGSRHNLRTCFDQEVRDAEEPCPLVQECLVELALLYF
jgi:hypothetical protein